jgi:transcriptional regulator with XRE-family HTH domain
MEEIPQQTPGLQAAKTGATMNLTYATAPERVLAVNLREARERLGLTQKNVADRMSFLGFSMMHTTVAKIEAGQRPVRLNEAFGLANCVGESIFSLLGVSVRTRDTLMTDAFQAKNELEAMQAQVLDLIRKEERRHRRALRKYLSDRLAELGPEEE